MLPTFSERIVRRLRVWWGAPPERGDWHRRYSFHRLRERYTLRRRDDPDEAWRCCALWPRTLISKWNSREFVARHGGRIPALYWHARLPSRRRLGRLPSHFVIRPIWGEGGRGVYVVASGRDLRRGAPFSPATLRRDILTASRFAWTLPVLAEEFIWSEAGHDRLPVEYKCHTFGDTVAAVEMIMRTDKRTRASHRFYEADWRPFADPMYEGRQAELTDPPPGLDEMLALAARLGAAVGTYIRVDFFGTERGCVFNEFSSTPNKGDRFTALCNDLFGSLWAEKFPDAT